MRLFWRKGEREFCDQHPHYMKWWAAWLEQMEIRISNDSDWVCWLNWRKEYPEWNQ